MGALSKLYGDYPFALIDATINTTLGSPYRLRASISTTCEPSFNDDAVNRVERAFDVVVQIGNGRRATGGFCFSES
jgi:hypothetical protein